MPAQILDDLELGPNGDFLVRTSDSDIPTRKWDDRLTEGAQSLRDTLSERYPNEDGALDLVIGLGEHVGAMVSRASAKFGVPADPVAIDAATDELAMSKLYYPLDRATIDPAALKSDIAAVATAAYINASTLAA